MNRKQLVELACLAVVLAAPGWGADGDAPMALEPGTVSRFSPGAVERIQFTIELPGDSRTVYLGARARPDRARFLLDGARVPHVTTYDYADFAGYEVALPTDQPAELQVELTSRTSLELFALVSRAEEDGTSSGLPSGFPGPFVVLSLAQASPTGFVAWFDRRRLGAVLVPRGFSRSAGESCGRLGDVEGLRSCAHSIVAAIDRCLVKHGAAMTSRRDALALYLDDLRIEEAVSELLVPDCRRVAALHPSRGALDRAGKVLAAAFARFETESPGVGGEQAAPGTEPPSTTTIDTALGAVPVIDGLESSCAGRSLLAALRAEDGPGEIIGLSLLVEELGDQVSGRTGRAVGTNDPVLLRAVDALRELPGPRTCDPTVAVMVILDEWRALASGSYQRYVDDGRRWVQRLRERKIPRAGKLQNWLAREFPVLHREASQALDYAF